MPRPLFEREVAEEERESTAERGGETTERRDVAVVEVQRWLLIVAEHAPPEALAAVVKSAAERGLLSPSTRGRRWRSIGVWRRGLWQASRRGLAAAVIYAATCTPAVRGAGSKPNHGNGGSAQAEAGGEDVRQKRHGTETGRGLRLAG